MGPFNEYLGVAVAVNFDPDIETIVAWTSIQTGAGMFGVHHSIPYITSLVTAVGIMRPTRIFGTGCTDNIFLSS